MSIILRRFIYYYKNQFKSNIRNFSLKMFKLSDLSLNIQFEKLWNDELNQLVNLFKENNFEIRIAGGAVRDILMNILPHDIDFATDATPSEMKEMFIKNNIRLINANGESHGTITPRINDKENFEITTLRIDRVTDGRRAEVEFTKDWKLDAERRDLTINSMFLDRDGTVYDYYNGYEDIKNRKIRFVGDSESRIQEDYLRILRYFRFFGRIATFPDDHLEEIIDKIQSNKSGLQRVSGERIWMELRKIVSGRFGPKMIEKMAECELLPFLGLPASPSLSELAAHHGILSKNGGNPAVFLSTLFEDSRQLMTAMERLKLSREEFILAMYIISSRNKLSNLMKQSNNDILAHFQNDFVMHIGEPSPAKLKLCYHEYFKYVDRLDLWFRFDEWKVPRFPVRGDVLRLKWNISGKKLGLAMQFLKKKWTDTNFEADTEELTENELFRTEFMKCELND